MVKSSPERMSWQRPSEATGPTQVTGAAVLEERPQACLCIPQAPGVLQAGNMGAGAASFGMQPMGPRGYWGVEDTEPTHEGVAASVQGWSSWWDCASTGTAQS